MASINFSRRLTGLTMVAALGVSGCSQEPRQNATPASEGSGSMAQSNSGDAVAVSPLPPEERPATSGEGVALPRASPAPSALFNAAYQRREDHWDQVLYLCDGIGGDRVKLVTMPNA